MVLTTSAASLRASVPHLQIPPAFARPGVMLYPGLNPAHNSSDPSHLIPETSKELYYSQEGHKPAIDGSKHANIGTNFTHPTVLLEHSNQIKSVKCIKDSISVVFTSLDAFQIAERTWDPKDGSFIVATYHVSCGNVLDGMRSFFKCSTPSFDSDTLSVMLPAVSQLANVEAIKEADVSWGTYSVPSTNKKRSTVNPRAIQVAQPSLMAGASGTVDLTTNFDALEYFFNVQVGNTSAINGPDLPDYVTTVDGDVYDGNSDDGVPTRRHIERRWFWSWIVAKVVNIVKAILPKFISDTIDAALNIYNKIRNGAIKVASAIIPGFSHEFTKSYVNTFPINLGSASQTTSQSVAPVFGIGTAFSVADIGAVGTIQCVDCGVKGSVDVDGRLGFSIAKGITTASLTINAAQTTVVIQFGISANGKISHEFNKQLFAVPLSPLTIPGIITLGPEVSLNTALNLAIDGSAQVLIGGTLTIAKGSTTLDVINPSQNSFTGFSSSFVPVAKAQGSISVTADLGLPVKLEFGLDVLNGLFKKSVALVDTPSCFITASVATDSSCNGIDFEFGIQNRIYLDFPSLPGVSKLDYNLRVDKIYSKNLGCVTLQGIGTPSKVRRQNSDPDVFQTVNNTFGGNLQADVPLTVDNVTTPTVPVTNITRIYRILMDQSETGVLVSGNDENLYLAPADNPDFDVSAPFGSPEGGSPDILTLDVYDRLLNYNPSDLNTLGVSPLRASNATAVPSGSRSINLIEVHDVAGDPGIFIVQAAGVNSPLALIACEILNKDTRVFVYNANFTLALTAANLGLLDVIAGGVVEQCDLISLTSGSEDGDTGGLTLAAS
ncbi:hypothetical protein MMC27_000331 [Xylographa pallens]|nr:hypothetical protein [Xylographa pallens]